MKRSEDENCAPEERPSASTRGETNEQGQSSGGGTGGPIWTADALKYLKQVHETFQNQPEKFQQFRGAMKDFKEQSIGTEGLIVRIKELLKGHNHLISGFNTFLPESYKITLDEDEPLPKKVEIQDAIDFMKKIKERFREQDNHVYKSVLWILKLCREGRKEIAETYEEVSLLLKDHPDLLDEFRRFSPDNSAAPKNA